MAHANIDHSTSPPKDEFHLLLIYMKYRGPLHSPLELYVPGISKATVGCSIVLPRTIWYLTDGVMNFVLIMRTLRGLTTAPTSPHLMERREIHYHQGKQNPGTKRKIDR